jgi:hypothetical protein
VGWHFDPVRKCVTAPFNNDLSLPLRDYSAGDLPFYCIRCWEEQKDAPAPWQDLSLAEKAVRLGLPLDDSISSSTQSRKVIARLNLLQQLVDAETVQTILDSKPRPFPTLKPMDKDARDKQALYGRTFELSMLMFDVKKCSCCGSTVPCNVDPLVVSMNAGKPFRLKHFRAAFHPAWHCQCDAFCRGGQFFSATRPKEMRLFSDKHGGHSPAQQLGVDAPNALLCHSCYNSGDDLQLARPFSARNGFGPIPKPPLVHSFAHELDCLLKQLTLAEEAAIRRITPMVSIVRMQRGNIATKGNTSCVWKSVQRLASVLPNLPHECDFIVVEWEDEPRHRLGSLKFSRRKVERVLQLLPQTGLAIWSFDSVSINLERLLQWPEDGNLSDIVPTIQHTAVGDRNAGNNAPADDTGLQHDGNDLGPAPLQAALAPEETFEGTIEMDSGIPSVAARVQCAETEASRLLHELTGVPIQFEDGGRAAHMPQADVFPTGGFVDMRRTKYAWHLAFPSVFRPAYVDGRFIVPWDVTAFVSPRECEVSYVDWHCHLLWRSDGFPSKHPTLALVLNNDHQRRSLQNQGRAALHLEDNIDPTTVTASAFMDNWVDGGPQQDGNGTDTETAFNQRFRRKLQWFVGNVRGTDQYWQQQCASFKATILYHSYVHGAVPNLFHTVSHAEFHDPFLRRLMAKYVSAVADDPDVGMAVLTDDSKYHRAIYDYKHVVTHFLAAKLETWIVTFLSPVLGLQHILGSTEFGSSRGAIHFHLLGYTASPADEAIDEALAQWAFTVYNAYKEYEPRRPPPHP